MSRCTAEKYGTEMIRPSGSRWRSAAVGNMSSSIASTSGSPLRSAAQPASTNFVEL
jgi:hypothetical protein